MRSFAALGAAPLVIAGLGLLALSGCGAAPTAVSAPAPRPTTTTAATTSTSPPPPIPIPAPQVAEAPAECKELVATPPSLEATKKACADARSALATMAAAALAESKHERAARDAAFAALSGCERVPLLVVDVVRAQLSPMACAETLLAPALQAHGKEALPFHQSAARALIGASRLSRLRPKKGEFDLLARAEADPAALEAAKKQLVLWRDAMEKEEGDAIALSKGAPPEIAAQVRFEIAAAWLALAGEIRATPLPPEILELQAKDPDLQTTYLAKLDEVTMPLVDRAQQLALAGLGIGVRDGVLVKPLASFAPVLEAFKSRPGFEVRPTRALDLAVDAQPLPAKSDAATIAAVLPPWAAYAALERAEPASLLSVPVLEAMAEHRGIPSALRLEVERDKKLDDAHRSAVALSRTTVALAYGSRPDAEAVTTWKSPKAPADRLRVTIDAALLGASSKAKPGDPKATSPAVGYDLAGLDALGKTPGRVGLAARYDAALLALDAAQLIGPDPADPMAAGADPIPAYEQAIGRLDAVAALSGLSPERVAATKRLADGARQTLALLRKPTKP